MRAETREQAAQIVAELYTRKKKRAIKKAASKSARGPLYSNAIYYPDSFAKTCTSDKTNPQPPAGGWGSLSLLKSFDNEKIAFAVNTQTEPIHPQLKRASFTPPPLDLSPVPKQRRAKRTAGKEKKVDISFFDAHLSIEPQKCYKLTNVLKLRLNPPPPMNTLYNCVRGYIPGEVTGKTYHKVVSCGKENCNTCGRDYSIVHNRRVNRAFDKIMQLSSVGYLVVTTPANLRIKFLNKRVLSDFRNFVRRKLKRDFDTRGLIRYHWCGDDCVTWKPHLNILMEGAFWEPKKLEDFRQAVAKWFVKYFNLSEPVPGNIYYQYVNPGKFTGGPEKKKAINKIKHWLKYVLRATAKEVKDVRVLDTIKGYNNTGYFGEFEKSEKNRSEATAILAGCDPETGEKIKWGERINPSVFNTHYFNYCREIICVEENKPPIHYGLFVTLHIDLTPAGMQLELQPDFNTFA